MSSILVSGLINIETTVRIEGFPIPYAPVTYPQHGVNSTVSGVGYNVAKALVTLGDRLRFLSLVGQDIGANAVYHQLREDNIPADYVLNTLAQTPQSVIMYDADGKRRINVDLKDIQTTPYPGVHVESAAQDVALAVLCNINFSRPLLRFFKERGVPVATDVHAISDLDHEYDRDFMAAADILFMSDENLPCSPGDWIRRVWDRYGTGIAVIGLGAEGALLGVRDNARIEHIPAVRTRPVVNTIGAGDALFSAFVHSYHHTGDPYLAIRQAVVFASYKVGATGAADGFLDAAGLDRLYARVMGG